MSSSNHTLESIAKLAGVSRSTVSRVINNKENVSEKSREKVLEVIEHVNYYPNASARSLASKRTNNIGVIFWGNDPLFLSKPIYFEIMQGIQKEVLDNDFDIMLYTSKKINENFCYKIIGQKAVDGLIIMGHVMYVDYLKLFYNADFPVVIIGKRYTDNLNVPYVCSNYKDGIFKAVKYLIQQNHKNIMLLVSDKSSLYEREKILGYKNALLEYNYDINKNIIIEGTDEKDIKLSLHNILNKQNLKVDGIIVSSDSLAYKTMNVLNKLKYNIPEDISIIGFDNINSSQNTNPPLTTVHQQKVKLGKSAVSMLKKQIEGKSVDTKILPTKLIIRSSVKKK